MAESILAEIVAKRLKAIDKKGVSFGFDIPTTRQKPIVPFPLEIRNDTNPNICPYILEIKRASPSKGDIAKDLDIKEVAKRYEKAGACGISVLTEENYFCGSLGDLMTVAQTVPNVPILRKDFLLKTQEIEISYLCGADAVLLIARILDENTLFSMVKLCKDFGIKALIEIHESDDLKKLDVVLNRNYAKYVAVGINSRNLSNFTLEPLFPLIMRDRINSECKRNSNFYGGIIYESGVQNENQAVFVASFGFRAMLIGEGAVKTPDMAQKMYNALARLPGNFQGRFWQDYAKILYKKNALDYNPIIKICGIKRVQDAERAIFMGADILGFVFSSESKRCATKKVVIESYKIKKSYNRRLMPILFVAVITEPTSKKAQEAFELQKEGYIDAIQYHGKIAPCIPEPCNKDFMCVPRYPAVHISCQKDLESITQLRQKGFPRVLLEAKPQDKDTQQGGNGRAIEDRLVWQAKELSPLWLAGGITPNNVADIIRKFSPELIDVSSGTEIEPGKKDPQKIKDLCDIIYKREWQR